MTFLKFLSVSTGLLGASGLSLFATYEFSKRRISDSLGKAKALSTDKSEKTVWEKLKKKIKEKKIQLHDYFKNLGDEDVEKLQNSCKETATWIYTSAFNGKSELLLNTFKAVCTITIKEVLGENGWFRGPKTGSGESEDKAEVQKSLQTLKSSTEDLKDEELSSIKKQADTNNQENWESLFKWCSNKYEESYTSSKSQDWTLVDKYCKRTNAK